MPATNVSEAQAVKIVAYLRSVAESRKSVAVAGDAARGKMIFDGKGDCDLPPRQRRRLTRGPRPEPSRTVAPNHRARTVAARSGRRSSAGQPLYRVTTKDGVSRRAGCSITTRSPFSCSTRKSSCVRS